VVGGPWSVGGGLVLGVLGNTLVAHVSIVARLVVGDGVGDNLGPAVGKGDAVRSAGRVSAACLVLGKVHLGVVVGDSITVVVSGGLIVFDGLPVGGPGGVRGGGVVGASNGHEGSEGEDELKEEYIILTLLGNHDTKYQ
jgi:hypothetical protein